MTDAASTDAPAPVTDARNEGIVLRRRPKGLLRHEDVELVPLPMPEVPPGGMLVRTDRIGIDATV
ncbi:MAG TPA: hypothetical protein VIL36_02525, partial [Acidimicrobiales bacterium]